MTIHTLDHAIDPVTPLARVERLTLRFPGRPRPAVDGVSFAVHPGECVALVGESGSGKTLTARALLGLLPAEAQIHGSIMLSEDPAPQSGAAAWDALRGAKVALVPQDALGALDPLRRIEHEVGDALRLHRIAAKAERRERVISELERAGMPQPESQLIRRSFQLSGGLRQRALIASALIASPGLIIADEPTTALDAHHRNRVLAEFGTRVREGAALLLISHDLASVRQVADRVLVMRDGRIVEQGTPEEVLSSPTHSFTRELIAASPKGKPRGTRLLTLRQTDASHLLAAAATPQSKSAQGETLVSGSEPTLSTRQSNPTAPRLSMREITASFSAPGNREAVLDGITLDVYAGETVGLVGASGSGKTTLLRIALGLHAPESGSVLVDGVDRSSLSAGAKRKLRRRLALVPQDPLDSFPRGAHGTAILGDALRAAGVPYKLRTAQAIELAVEVGLDPDLLDYAAARLSGGQRQRLAIARALARSPELLLLDEPVSALDVTVQARVLDLLDEVQERRGTGYLLVSHDAAVVEHMSDRVLRLENGSLVRLSA